MTYVGSKVQDAVTKGASADNFQELFDAALDSVDKIVDAFAQEGHSVEIVR
jgi:soluble cytochrome b562